MDLTNLVRARNQAQDEADQVKKELSEENDQLEETARRLKSNLSKQEKEFHEACKSIRRQTEELLRERDDQIQENEQTRTEMLEENETINEKQKRMVYEVAALEVRRKGLEEIINQADANVSGIPKDPYEGMPRLEDDSSRGHEAYPSSTPAMNRTNPFLAGYNPYVNEKAADNVRKDVYQKHPVNSGDCDRDQTRRNTFLNTGTEGTRTVHQGAPGGDDDNSDSDDSDEGDSASAGRSGGGRYPRERPENRDQKNASNDMMMWGNPAMSPMIPQKAVIYITDM